METLDGLEYQSQDWVDYSALKRDEFDSNIEQKIITAIEVR